MMTDFELETLEKGYLDFIVRFLRQDIKGLVEGLNSRIPLLNDWKDAFLRTGQSAGKEYPSDLDKGAERIFHHFFTPLFKFPNSCPIGSDLMYRMSDAIVHVEIKTNLITNIDFKGKVQLGRNQISYAVATKFTPNLPPTYLTVNLPKLTFVIQIIHEHMEPNVKALSVICIPNGQLFSHYGDKILQAGKGGWLKAKDIRYKYAKEPRFVLLSKKYNVNIFRIEVLALAKKLSIKDLTGQNLPITPFLRV